jgi:hypothetical protein
MAAWNSGLSCRPRCRHRNVFIQELLDLAMAAHLIDLASFPCRCSHYRLLVYLCKEKQDQSGGLLLFNIVVGLP